MVGSAGVPTITLEKQLFSVSQLLFTAFPRNNQFNQLALRARGALPQPSSGIVVVCFSSLSSKSEGFLGFLATRFLWILGCGLKNADILEPSLHVFINAFKHATLYILGFERVFQEA